MANWFFAFFLWYGVVTWFQQIPCFGSTRPKSTSTSTSTEENHQFRYNTQSSNLQRKERFVGVTDRQINFKGSFKRTVSTLTSFTDAKEVKNKLKVNNRNSLNKAQSEVLKGRQKAICCNKNVAIKENNSSFKVRAKRFSGGRRKAELSKIRPSANLNVQVPDEDIEDDGREQSGESDETATEFIGKQPNVLRYFYRNNKRMLVDNDQEESDRRYKGLNKGFEEDGGLRADQKLTEVEKARQRLETVLHKADAFGHSGDIGPTFKNTMIWVNMMRASRGWFPKGTYE